MGLIKASPLRPTVGESVELSCAALLPVIVTQPAPTVVGSGGGEASPPPPLPHAYSRKSKVVIATTRQRGSLPGRDPNWLSCEGLEVPMVEKSELVDDADRPKRHIRFAGRIIANLVEFLPFRADPEAFGNIELHANAVSEAGAIGAI